MLVASLDSLYDSLSIADPTLLVYVSLVQARDHTPAWTLLWFYNLNIFDSCLIRKCIVWLLVCDFLYHFPLDMASYYNSTAGNGLY